MTSSCFVWPLTTAPSVTTASISLFDNNSSLTRGMSYMPGTLQMSFTLILSDCAFSCATTSMFDVIIWLNSETTIAMFRINAPMRIRLALCHQQMEWHFVLHIFEPFLLIMQNMSGHPSSHIWL